jgi:hypothetical protein
MDAASPSADRWYHRPLWVVVLLFVVLGPLGLPALWKSPSFSRAAKVVLTVAVIAYMALFVDESIRVLRAIEQGMPLGVR